MSSDDTSLFLNIGYSPTPVSCKVHPLVIFSILDHFARRNESQSRVIGTLLGLNYDGVIEVKNCFPVPHHDIDDKHDTVAVDKDFHKKMFELHQRANPSEIIVGWYATGSDITESSLLIHDFFWKEMQLTNQHIPPIQLLVSTDLENAEELSVRAFISAPLSLSSTPEKPPLGAHFQPLSMEFVTHEAERFAVDQFIKNKSEDFTSTNPLPTDLQSLECSIRKLLSLITDVAAFVDKVVDGKITPDRNIGRLLSEAVAALPKLDSVAFEKLFNHNLQDLLMTTYLSNLTRTQLILAERLIGSNPILLNNLKNTNVPMTVSTHYHGYYGQQQQQQHQQQQHHHHHHQHSHQPSSSTTSTTTTTTSSSSSTRTQPRSFAAAAGASSDI